jgi:hypothetical protein
VKQVKRAEGLKSTEGGVNTDMSQISVQHFLDKIQGSVIKGALISEIYKNN